MDYAEKLALASHPVVMIPFRRFRAAFRQQVSEADFRYGESRIVQLACIYGAVRIVHSLIHLSYNRLLHRMFAFAASNVVWIARWIMLFGAMRQGSAT